ncbi:MAG TPA: hypothetical protein VEK33_09390 [Terriglobales bacterium]|nr:hypothetical protein [Terriglobales bacterium]
MEKQREDPRKVAWLPEMDRLLRLGVKHGPAGIQLVTKQLKQLAPALTPGEIWGRMRHLREGGSPCHRDPSRWPPELIELLKDGYRDGGTKKREAFRIYRVYYPGVPSYVISRFARREGWLLKGTMMATRKMHRAWSKHEDQVLWRLAGYESPQQIAHKLKRTEGAVRCRLKAQGLSGKVKDGMSLRAFQEMFHIGHRKAYVLIARGMLKVRNARISITSAAAFCKQRDRNQNSVDVRNAKKANHSGLSWERVADLLGTSLDQVQGRLATGQLKVVDTFVTEKALEEFCRSCGRNGGPKLNYRLLDPKVVHWLKDYGIAIPHLAASSSVPGSEKHALVARLCKKCQRTIRGNAYFIHSKRCKGAVASHRVDRGPAVYSSNCAYV